MSDPLGRRIERLFEGEAPPIALMELDPEVTTQPSISPGRRVALIAGVGVLMGLLLIVILAIRSDQPENPVVSQDDSGWEVVEFPEGFSSVNAVMVWTDDDLVFWGGQTPDVEESPTGEPGMAYNLETREWRTLPPSPKDPAIGAAGAWTGDELIICCGVSDQFADFPVTVALDPETDQWRRLADAPISGTYSEAFWTGEEMLVVASGGVAGYDPMTDSWTTYPPPPTSARLNEIAWTGEELIVWSREVERAVHPGYALSLSTSTWRQLPDPPAWPAAPDIVWTGEHLVVWGGLPAHFVGSERAVGSVYDPATNSWTVMSEALPEPEAFEGNLGSQSMVWTGEAVIVSPGPFGSGADPERSLLLTYYPTSDAWELLNQALLPVSFVAADVAVAGDRVVVRSDRLYISPAGWMPEGEPITADSWTTTTTVPTTTTTSGLPTTAPDPLEGQGEWTRIVDGTDSLGGAGDQVVAGVATGQNEFVAVGEDEKSFGSSEDDQAAVWRSESGVEWSRVDADPSFVDAAMTDVVWFPDSAVYVAVGHYISEGAVWLSEDGRVWERVALLGFDGPGGGIEVEAITVGGPGVVAVGREWLSEGLSIPAVWMSPDGREWARVGDLTQFSDNAAMVDVVEHSDTLYAAGFVEQTLPAVWTFTDNSFWELISVGPQIARDAYLTSIASDGERLVVAGGSSAEDVDARVWTSSDDGQTWVARRQLPRAGGIPNLSDLAVSSSGWVAVGGDSATYRPVVGAAVWTSLDGIDWKRYSPGTSAFSPEDAGVVMTTTVVRGEVVIAGGFTGQNCAERYARCELDAAFWIWLP